MSMPIRFTKRDDFVAALEARRLWATAIDKANTVKHKADERAALDRFRAECRSLAKKSYAELKATNRRRSIYVTFDPPSCPDSMVGKIDRVLAVLASTKQETFTLDSEGAWRAAHFLLTHDENAHQTVC